MGADHIEIIRRHEGVGCFPGGEVIGDGDEQHLVAGCADSVPDLLQLPLVGARPRVFGGGCAHAAACGQSRHDHPDYHHPFSSTVLRRIRSGRQRGSEDS